jgi:hypothetical protein
LATGSTAQIKSSELVSRLLISVVHQRPDGRGGWLRPGAARAHARGATSWPSAVARRSSTFLELWWLVFDEVCSYGITTTRGLDYANHNRWRATTECDNGEAARSVLGDGEGSLR